MANKTSFTVDQNMQIAYNTYCEASADAREALVKSAANTHKLQRTALKTRMTAKKMSEEVQAKVLDICKANAEKKLALLDLTAQEENDAALKQYMLHRITAQLYVARVKYGKRTAAAAKDDSDDVGKLRAQCALRDAKIAKLERENAALHAWVAKARPFLENLQQERKRTAAAEALLDLCTDTGVPASTPANK